MQKVNLICLIAGIFISITGNAQFKVQPDRKSVQVQIINGTIEGNIEPGGVYSFKGIPYAAPPVGDLRWKAPEPARDWKGVLQTKRFGASPMQPAIYKDMVFRSSGMSEDCLFLNVWAPSKPHKNKLPVFVYFHGGGFIAGDGSEPRYDGESMAAKGIVMVTVNYRLGIFGFLTLPGLDKESPWHSSGNYGLLDQNAALKWVHKNIAAFGGDPSRVTIGGQSAGSMSVSSQMASPLSKGLFARAIGESGSVLGNLLPRSLKASEKMGAAFLSMANASGVEDLRKMPADKLLKIYSLPDAPRFGPTIDGYFFPHSPAYIYERGLQADVPLLAGWNSAEVSYRQLLKKELPTPDNYKKAVTGLYGKYADKLLKLYPGNSSDEVVKSATELAGDRFIAYATWKWIFAHSITDGYPVYRYVYKHLLPPAIDTGINGVSGNIGAPHSAEIPYALGNLNLVKAYRWTADDYKVSATMQAYFVNFIKTGNPNGNGLPQWFGLQSSIPKVMNIDTKSGSEPEQNLKRYLLLDEINAVQLKDRE